jgi:hypothetical protein
MDGADVGVLEETNEIGLSSLLQGVERGGLPANGLPKLLGDLASKALESKLADQEPRGALVATDLAKRNGTWKCGP